MKKLTTKPIQGHVYYEITSATGPNALVSADELFVYNDRIVFRLNGESVYTHYLISESDIVQAVIKPNHIRIIEDVDGITRAISP